MFARVLSTVAVGTGVALGTIALLAVPGVALGGVLFGAFIGVLAFAVATSRSPETSHRGTERAGASGSSPAARPPAGGSWSPAWCC